MQDVPYERLQVLVRPDQAELLRRTARQRGVPVTQLVRDALDQSLGGRSLAERGRAWQQFDSLAVVPGGPDHETLEDQLDDRTGHAWLSP